MVLGLFLNAYAVYDYVCAFTTTCALALFLLIPQKIFNTLRGYSWKYDGELVDEYLIKGKQEDFRKRKVDDR